MKTCVIHEKGSGQINEDAYSLNHNLFGVFDGATSLTGETFTGNKTGGFLASTIARDIFHKNNATLTCLAEKANAAIFQKMAQEGVDTSDKSALWSTSCAVVRIDDDAVEWVQTGDSLILVIFEDGSYHIPVTDPRHDVQTLMMWKNLASRGSDKKIFDLLGNQIRKIRCGMNVNYGVLNGEDASMEFLNTGSISRKHVKHILLFTDGLFLPSEYPDQEPDFDTFVSVFLQKGLHALRDHVRHIEQSDPDCRVYPRFKPHDDIAAVSISF